LPHPKISGMGVPECAILLRCRDIGCRHRPSVELYLMRRLIRSA
jgi:hypothetical protein